MSSTGGASGKESACQCRKHNWWRFDLWVGKIPWWRDWQPTPVFLPEESHGQRSLVTVHNAAKIGHSWTHTYLTQTLWLEWRKEWSSPLIRCPPNILSPHFTKLKSVPVYIFTQVASYTLGKCRTRDILMHVLQERCSRLFMITR